MDQPKVFESIDAILADFDLLGAETSSFSKATGLTCMEKCGRCCEKPSGVWAKVSELLPAARELWESGRALAVIDELSTLGDTSVCIFYKADPFNLGAGRCGAYKYRPLTCRLFGSSIRKSKVGASELMLCKTQKEMYSADHKQRVIRQIESGETSAPVAQDWSFRLQGHISSESNELELPINEALQKAIEALSWYYPR